MRGAGACQAWQVVTRANDIASGRLPSFAAVGRCPSCCVRQCDLFPLPFLSESCIESRCGLSHATARCHQHREAWAQWTNDGRHILNLLARRGLAVPKEARRPAACPCVVDQTASAYRDLGLPPCDALSPEGALRELLASAQFNQQESADACPSDRNFVSWPLACGR
jgi:hypothetical protein